MAVRCAKCGEELLGAVNRCWKCGQTFALHPEIDGRPPVRFEIPVQDSAQPLQAQVLDEPVVGAVAPSPVSTTPYAAAPLATKPSPISTADRIDAQRKSLMAMGGTVGSLALGLFALIVAWFRVEGALIAMLGLIMGIWGLYSPRRKLAFVAMLLCCLAIGVGAFTGAKQLRILILKNRPSEVVE